MKGKEMMPFVNHSSLYNEWFRDALSNPESEYRDYYLIQDTEPENMSMWWQDEETGLYYYGHYDSIMPDFNYDNAADDTVKLPSKNTLILKCAAGGTLLSADEFSKDISEGEYTITVSVTLPDNMPMDENIYIVGTFNDWNECDENYIMTRTSETTCEIKLTAEAYSSMEYKFTRGSWDMREQNAAGEDLVGPLQKQNREYIFETDEDVLECTIDKWSDI